MRRLRTRSEPMRLDDDLTRRVLSALHITPSEPDIAQLDALVAAYVRRVPWESASRIARGARTPRIEDCPRWPDSFWQQALAQGTGGTCFESNYAFFALLQSLGYTVDLTINNMRETAACHTALIVHIAGQRWLVDVGIPLHVPLPLSDTATARASAIHDYSATPDDAGNYIISRSRHPEPYIFTLIDRPVDEVTYRAALQADYGPGGYFLDRVVINKIVDEQLWRYNSGESPAHLQRFADGEREDVVVNGAVSERIATLFGIQREVVLAAFDALETGGAA